MTRITTKPATHHASFPRVFIVVYLFGMKEYSPYCCSLNSMSDICIICQVNICTLLKAKSLYNSDVSLSENNKINFIKRLLNLAIEFNINYTVAETSNICGTILDPDNFGLHCQTNKDDFEGKFDCVKFYNFIRYNMTNDDTGRILYSMKEFRSYNCDNNEYLEAKLIYRKWYLQMGDGSK